MFDPILKSPYPYFGGKRKVAAEIWARFGAVKTFNDPFFGSGAVLLGREHWRGGNILETVNDVDGLLVNFWRALKHNPDAVTEYADYPISHTDLTSRHKWLLQHKSLTTQQLEDPEWYDAKAAGWWVWGASQWIGHGWCVPRSINSNKMPELTSSRGAHRLLPGDPVAKQERKMYDRAPHLSHRTGTESIAYDNMPNIGGRGVNRKGLVDPDNVNITERTDALRQYFRALSERLRQVRIVCGDWKRLTTPATTIQLGVCGMVLDPPYLLEGRSTGVYAHDTDVAQEVRLWAIENGKNPLFRLALCGYADDKYPMPSDWSVFTWKSNGGYGNQAEPGGLGRENAERETIWFSPHCLSAGRGQQSFEWLG